MSIINLNNYETIKINGDQIKTLKIGNETVWTKQDTEASILALFNCESLNSNNLVKEMRQALLNYSGNPIYTSRYSENNLSIDSKSFETFNFMEFSNMESLTAFVNSVNNLSHSSRDRYAKYFFLYKHDLEEEIPNDLLLDLNSQSDKCGFIDFEKYDFEQKLANKLRSLAQNNFEACFVFHNGDKNYFCQEIEDAGVFNPFFNINTQTTGISDTLDQYFQDYYTIYSTVIVCEADMLEEIMNSFEPNGIFIGTNFNAYIICLGKNNYALEMLRQNKIKYIICEDTEKFAEFLTVAENALEEGREIKVDGVKNESECGFDKYIFPLKVIE